MGPALPRSTSSSHPHPLYTSHRCPRDLPTVSPLLSGGPHDLWDLGHLIPDKSAASFLIGASLAPPTEVSHLVTVSGKSGCATHPSESLLILPAAHGAPLCSCLRSDPIQLSVTSLRVSDSMKLFLTLSLPSQEKGPQLYAPHGDVWHAPISTLLSPSEPCHLCRSTMCRVVQGLGPGVQVIALTFSAVSPQQLT